MGSGDWFKTIISIKKVKDDSSKQPKQSEQGSTTSTKSNGFKWKNKMRKESAVLANGSSRANPRFIGMPVEDVAAIQIQTAFRAYMARKTLRCLKGTVRLQIITQNYSVKKQAATTLNYLHSWSQTQAQIRARRLCMVTESRLRQKKLENQLKLEAKLHDLEVLVLAVGEVDVEILYAVTSMEFGSLRLVTLCCLKIVHMSTRREYKTMMKVEWCGGSDTMEGALARIHQREEAAVKRERTMAYAFSHQWRASTGHSLGLVNYELGKANWGWSWKERWIAARPWESRVPVKSASPNKMKNKQANKVDENTKLQTKKTPVSSKPSLSNGRAIPTARRLSYPPAEKQATLEGSLKSEAANAKHEHLVS